ncbi:hypothetical protein, partial [Romboutsia ilealis]|uniref:hypothetical protein n=1 Tax=Romboutsia ilealis TaxID=1115758 RepID=UPI002729743A
KFLGLFWDIMVYFLNQNRMSRRRRHETVFCITDLLPHLAQNQMQKKLADGITGEQLNLLFGHHLILLNHV